MIHFFPVMKMLKIPDFPMPQNRLKTRIREKLLDAFDVNYAVSEIRIETTEDFEKALYMPFAKGEKIYYRGERISTPTRRLVPTLLRESELFAPKDTRPIFEINCQSRRFKPSTKRFTAKRKKKTCIPCLRLPSTIWI